MFKNLVTLIACMALAALLVFYVNPTLRVKRAQRVVTYKSYITKKYPLITPGTDYKKFFATLDYYTYPNPESTIKNIPNSDAQHLKPGAYYCMNYVTPCGNVKGGAYFKNYYQMNHLSKSKYYKGYPNNSYVEVYHQGWYPEPGLFFYVAKGTGIYLNVGKTLIARNKVDALHKLGLSSLDIFLQTPDISIGGRFMRPIDYFATHASKKHESIQQYINQVFDPNYEEQHYKISMFGAFSSLDGVLYRYAKQAGYDTVQLTTQRNASGGWGYELLDIRPGVFKPIKQKWEREERYLSVRNPLNLKQGKSCKLQLPFTNRIQCK